jgi:CO/xanthine dehydrogenase FAD-binding subunit
MLRLPKFKFLAPSSIDEASSLLKNYEENVKILAGGTDILPLMKDRVRTPEYVLGLNSVSGLKNIRNGPDEEITIGALSTLTAIVESPLLNRHFSALVEAAGLVGSPPSGIWVHLVGILLLRPDACFSINRMPGESPLTDA